MSFAKNFFILSSFLYLSRFLSVSDKKDLKKAVDTKIKKYNISVNQVMEIIEVYKDNPKGIRNEPIGINNTIDSTYQIVDKIDSEKLEKDLEEIIKVFSNKVNKAMKSEDNKK